MNTLRVKNLVIIMLLVVNVVLGALILDNENRYKLSNKQETAIRTILSQNSIGLYTLLPTDYTPKRMLQLQPYTFDEEMLVQLLFQENAAVSKLDGTESSYTSGDTTLYVNGGHLVYVNPDGFIPAGQNQTPHSDARKLCDALVGTLSTSQIKFVMNEPTPVSNDGATVYEYRGRYNDWTLYSNYIKIRVTDAGITELSCYFTTPEGFTGEARDMYSCDEALLSLLGELKSIYGNMDSEIIVITRMDVVYHLESAAQGNQNALKAVPYYRIYTRMSPETPFLINAYNNNMLR